jgi:hypothetical protein
VSGDRIEKPARKASTVDLGFGMHLDFGHEIPVSGPNRESGLVQRVPPVQTEIPDCESEVDALKIAVAVANDQRLKPCFSNVLTFTLSNLSAGRD